MQQRHAAIVTPPREGSVRVLACTTSTAVVQLETDAMFTKDGVSRAAGPTIVRFHAQGGDIFVLFGLDNAVVSDPAAVAGDDRCDRIPADQERDYLINPKVDKFFSARTSTGTATLRYRIAGPPTNSVA